MNDKAQAESQPAQQATRSIIVPLTKIFERVYQQQPNQSWLAVWTAVLELDPKNRRLYSALDLVAVAIDRTHNLLESSEVVPEFSKKKAVGILSTCASFLNPSILHKQNTDGRENFNGDKISMLMMAADHFDRLYREPEYSADQIATISGMLDEIEKVLAAGQLPPFLTQIITAHIHTIRWAISHYQLVGVDGLMRACADAVIELRRADESEDVAMIKEGFGRVWDYVDRTDKLVRLGERAYQLGKDGGGKLLELMSGS